MDHILNNLLSNAPLGKIKQISTEFISLTNDFDRFDYAYRTLNQASLLTSIFESITCIRKSASESKSFRNKGNVAFKNKEYYEALILYTQSVAFAPHEINSEELSLALANRSVVLFTIEEYNLSLKDIDLSIKFHYPLNLKYKIFERKGKILQNQGFKDAALENFKISLEMVQYSNLTPDKRIQFENDIQGQMIKEIIIPIKEKENECKNIPDKSYGQHHHINSSSDSIDLSFNNEIGRHFIATRDIQPGDILIVEKPFASILLKDYLYTHCSNCLKRNLSLNPCQFCSTAMFCSDECFDCAWSTSHKIECDVLPVLKSLNLTKLQHLAIRVVLNATLCGVKVNEVFEKLSKESKCDNKLKLGYDINDHYDSNNYSTIYNLIANSEKRTLDDLFKRAVYSGIIIGILEKKSNFFQNNFIKKEQKKFLGGLILRHLQNLPCNAHEISELVMKYDKANNFSHEMIEIGAGAYATLSLLNHSCNPNVSRFCYEGDICVIRAIRVIKKGSELLDNYGHHFALELLTERDRFLNNQYFFSCQCDACISNWPLYDSLPDDYPQYKCIHCSNKLNIDNNSIKIKCHCGKITDIIHIKKIFENSTKIYKQIFNDVLMGQEFQDYQPVIQHLILLEKHYILPWKEFNDCQELLKHCFNTKGNCFKFLYKKFQR